MSGVILYQSKYGATKRYAEWLSEETGFDCTETRKASIDEVATYDIVILPGCRSWERTLPGLPGKGSPCSAAARPLTRKGRSNRSRSAT